MMISQEQARAAAQHLSTCGATTPYSATPDVSPEVIAAAVQVVRETPDTSPQRMSQARSYLSDGADSRLVASMMIQRIISDSLR